LYDQNPYAFIDGRDNIKKAREEIASDVLKCIQQPWKGRVL